jgi:DNA-directed RNA polymerase specialized sigma24 family protein
VFGPSVAARSSRLSLRGNLLGMGGPRYSDNAIVAGAQTERTQRGRDEEDVALSAFDSFFRAAEAGRFPRLDDRDDLWQVLVMITLRKAADQARREGRQKRGGGQVALASEMDEDGAFAAVIAREPDPAFAAEMADGCRWLLEVLGDDTLRKIAVAKMEGDSNEQIAERLNVSLATVERKLRGIRGILEKSLAE